MKKAIVPLVTWFVSWLICVAVRADEIITSSILGENVNGLLAAFGDFNADKLTDVFFITDKGKTVAVYFAHPEKPILNKPNISCSFDGYAITSVVPGDYDGDNYMDILVTLNRTDAFGTFVKILWGNMTTVSNCTVNQTLLEQNSWRYQPLVLDYNADKIPDVYGEMLDGQRQVWIMKNRTFRSENISIAKNKIRRPHSNAFLDLNHDMAADIFVTTENGTEKKYEIWYNENGRFKNYEEGSFNIPGAKSLGQSAFADFNVDGHIDHVVPACSSDNCNIYVYYDYEWLPLIQSSSEKQKIQFYSEKFPVTLRIGDFNLDGYPDILTILMWTTPSILIKGTSYQQAVLLENVPCAEKFKRCFNPRWNYTDLSTFNDVVQVAFYDFYQDGSLDFLLVRKLKDKKYKVEAVKNSFVGDVCFLKVLVVSGLCYQNCPKESDPYGVNQPGPFISYNTTRQDGTEQRGCAAQLSQTAYFALQLPYTVFGLGQTPNFVNSLAVGLPKSTRKEEHTNKWSFIIPNSQVVAIPLQEKERYRWMLKLFVTPSHQVWMTALALLGVCFLVAILIGGLHWKEKAEDKREKLQEAHKFHFDAM